MPRIVNSRLRNAIRATGLPAGAIAGRARIHPVTLSHVLNGRHQARIETAIKLASVLRCRPRDLGLADPGDIMAGGVQ